jgi:hypothetical protein
MTSPTPKHEWNADQKSEIMQCHKLGIIAIANLYDNKFDIVVPSPTINGTAFSSMFTRAGQKIVTQINTAKKLPSNS